MINCDLFEKIQDFVGYYTVIIIKKNYKYND